MSAEPHPGARHLNQSLGWHELAREKLAQTPTCEECASPAMEIHVVEGGCFVKTPRAEVHENPDFTVDDVVALCRPCHDSTSCTIVPPPSPLFRALFG